MIVEGTVAALLFLAYKRSSKKGVMSPEREKAYTSALENLTDPVRLFKLADIYEKEGLKVEATMLRKRAELRAQTPEQKKTRRDAYDKGMASTNPEAIEVLANAFEQITATGAAAALRQRAAELREKAATKADDELGPAETTQVHVQTNEVPHTRSNKKKTNGTPEVKNGSTEKQEEKAEEVV